MIQITNADFAKLTKSLFEKEEKVFPLELKARKPCIRLSLNRFKLGPTREDPFSLGEKFFSLLNELALPEWQ